MEAERGSAPWLVGSHSYRRRPLVEGSGGGGGGHLGGAGAGDERLEAQGGGAGSLGSAEPAARAERLRGRCCGAATAAAANGPAPDGGGAAGAGSDPARSCPGAQPRHGE